MQPESIERFERKQTYKHSARPPRPALQQRTQRFFRGSITALMPPTTSTKLGRGPLLLGLLTLLLPGLFYTSLQYVETNVSPQGCRMSWMHPSSILMKDFDTKWTRLGGRYTLWLYREKHGDGVWDVGLDQVSFGLLWSLDCKS